MTNLDDVAIAINVHKINWMWANPEAFKKAGAKIPATWPEFETAAKKIKAAGCTPMRPNNPLKA